MGSVTKLVEVERKSHHSDLWQVIIQHLIFTTIERESSFTIRLGR